MNSLELSTGKLVALGLLVGFLSLWFFRYETTEYPGLGFIKYDRWTQDTYVCPDLDSCMNMTNHGD